MQGPYPILCRGHSGGRLVCEAFIRNAISMGVVRPKTKDSSFFSIRDNAIVRKIIMNCYDYLRTDTARQHHLQNLVKQTVHEFLETEVRNGGPFGWKIDPTVFTMPVVMDAFPEAKTVHVIRDGRDVMLSRLNSRFRYRYLVDPINRLMVFGDATVNSYKGLPLTRKTIEVFRNELEMKHWVTSVNYGILGRKYRSRYFEIKYEDICAEPVETFQKIFDFIDVPFLPETRTWLGGAVTVTRIGKWKRLSGKELEEPLSIGHELLETLGYT